MVTFDKLLIFSVDDQCCAFELSAVERVTFAVTVRPVPDAPPSVLGLVNMQGRVLPVLDLREWLGLPRRELAPDDRFIIARGGEWRIAVLATEVAEVRTLAPEEALPAECVLPGLRRCVEGVVTVQEGIILIYDLGKLLAQCGEELLEVATEGAST